MRRDGSHLGPSWVSLVLLVVGAAVLLALPGGGGRGGGLSSAHVPAKSTLSSASFCVGARQGSGLVSSTVVDDLGAKSGLVDSVLSDREGQLPIRLAAGRGSRVRFPASAATRAVSATFVDLGGPAVAWLYDEGKGLASELPCPKALSRNWYVAGGSTLGSSDLFVDVYDPMPSPAIVDFTFATNSGESTPPDLQGMVIPSGSVKEVDVGRHVVNAKWVAASVQARVGEVAVAARATRGGQSVLLQAAPRASLSWSVPFAVGGPGSSQSYEVYNPGQRAASVRLSVTSGGVAPRRSTSRIGPGRTVVLHPSLSGKAGSDSVFASELHSTAPVVVSSSVRLASPSRYVGWSGALASSTWSHAWVLPPAPVLSHSETYVVVQNLSGSSAKISVSSPQGKAIPTWAAAFSKATVAPGASVALKEGALSSTIPALLLRSAADVVVEVVALSPTEIVEEPAVELGG